MNKKAMNKLVAVLICSGILLLPDTVFAYVGPGAGLSLLGALWALLVALGTAILFLLAWPIRRMRRRKREAKERDAKERDAKETEAPEHEHKADDDNTTRTGSDTVARQTSGAQQDHDKRSQQQ